ncbi:MAG TPA: hypothetical protein VG407_17215 [Caulobacteraceae bacterium]|jgi:hypothetical protein|nr:hypothetical protein [Caulobacteraceae bacterium]
MCGMALAASLALADLYGAGGGHAIQPAVANPLAAEPLYADIVGRARELRATVVTLEATPGLKQSAAAIPLQGFDEVATKAQALSSLDMKGHVDLAARDKDGDLKCILKGISQDLPKRIADIRDAKTGPDEARALDDLAYLLDDNVGVITALPKAPV